MLLGTIEPEFKLCGFNGGVKLHKPESHHFISSKMGLIVHDIYKMPCHSYFLNTQSEVQFINEENIKFFKGTSIKEFVGLTAKNFFRNDDALGIINNDKKVLKSKNILIIEECALEADGLFSCISIKVPWYNQHNKIIGVFGCSFPIISKNMKEILTYIYPLGLLFFPETLFFCFFG